MAQPDKKSIPPAGGQKLHLIKSSTWNKIRKLLEMADLLPDPTQFETIERAGKKHFRLRPQDLAATRAGGGGTTPLPFTLSVTPTSIIASAGTINGDSHAAETSTTMTDGTWYFRAKVIINSSTGAITSTDVLWDTTEASNTTTDFYQTIGTVDIIAGVPDSGTIVQNTYGPMLLVIYGTPTDKWGVTIY